MTSAQRNNGERGNAFFIVMVGVVLFGALMFTFSRGVRQGGDNLTEKQVHIAASEVISTAQQYQRAISRMRLKGCSENQISFDDHNDTLLMSNGNPYNYANGNSPPDFSCHVFNPAGGGLSPKLLPLDYVADNSLVCGGSCLHSRSPHFTSLRIVGHESESGAAGAELVLWLGRVTRELCMEINNKLGIENPGGAPPVDPWGCDNNDAPFTGTFANCTNPIGDAATALAGKDSFCVAYDTSGWTYSFMTVLIPR